MPEIILQNDDPVTNEVVSLTTRELPIPSSVSDRYLRDLVHFTSDEPWKTYDEKSLFNQAVLEAETKLQVPREMAITSALGAMAVACQSLIDVQQPSGNKVNTSLMLLTIAESGERKTTVEKQFFREIKQFQTRKLEEQVPELKRYQAELSLWLEHQKVLNTLYKKAIKADYEEEDGAEDQLKRIEDKIKAHQENEPERPFTFKFIYEDTTPQALLKGMVDNCKYACVLSSEANTIFAGKTLSDLGMVNTLWDGEMVTVDRKSDGYFNLVNARLTMSLMTQMSVIEQFMSKRGEAARGTGFLARFLVVRPQRKAGTRNTNTSVSEMPAVALFNERIKLLLTQLVGQLPSEPQKTTLTFTQEAQQLWNKVAQLIENEMKPYGIYEFYTDHGSKLMDNITRVAGVVHYFENANQPDNIQIDKATLEFAYSTCFRYSKHFLQYLAQTPPLIVEANNLVDFIKRNKLAEDAKRKGQDRTQNDDPRYYPDIDDNVYNYLYESDEQALTGGVSCKLTFTTMCQFGPSALRNPLDNYGKLRRVLTLLERMNIMKEVTKENTTWWHFDECTLSEYSISLQNFQGEGTITNDKTANNNAILEGLQAFVTDFQSSTNLNQELSQQISVKNGEEYTLTNLPLFSELQPCVFRPATVNIGREYARYNTTSLLCKYAIKKSVYV